jgi:regulator of nonsense transcripts 2
MLLSYINEVEQRAEAKLQLREKNQAPSRPDEAALAKLDSSLKKNTAFVRKLVIDLNGPESVIVK